MISGTTADNDGDSTTDEPGELNLPAGAASDLVADPANVNRYYAALLGQGVCRSDNGGANWRRVSSGIAGLSGSLRIGLVVHHNGAAGTNAVWAAVVGKDASITGVFRSGNQGGNWTPTNSAPATGRQGFRNLSIVADSDDPQGVFVGGESGSVGNDDVMYVGAVVDPSGAPVVPQLWLRQIRSEPQGTEPFTQLTTYGGGVSRDIMLDPDDWRVAYVLDTSARIWRTTDAGATAGNWTELTGDPDGTRKLPRVLRSIEFVRAGGGLTPVLLVGGYDGVHRRINPAFVI